MLGVHSEVVHDFAVVHVVGVVLWDGEITVTHHFLGSVNGHRFINTGFPISITLLQEGTKPG